MPYTKLDAGIIFSTVWREPHTTVRVWIALLAMKDRRGEVLASIPGLADAARVTLPECETALATFRAPDKYSRTRENKGRRIEDIDGGWFVLNHEKFRALEDTDEQRRKAAIRAKRFRERNAVTHDEALRRVTRVTVTQKSRQADADADADADSKDLTTFGFASTWKLYPRRAGGNSRADAEKCWNARVKQGVSEKEMHDGTERYAAFCRATGKERTEYVKQGRTFYGPACHWQEPWEIPAKKGALDWDAATAKAKEDEDRV